MAEQKKRTASEQGKASRDKGKRFERYVANLFREYGITAKRTAQYCGKTGQAGDVEGVPGIHIECKAVERLNLEVAYQQSVRDAQAADKGQYPIVIHKRSRRPAMVTMALEDWIVMYLAWRKECDEYEKG